jgi:septum formation topological specificity factor MinE
MKKWHHQKGMTAIGWMLVLGLIAFFTLITLRMVPLYLEYGKVASTLESLKDQPNITRQTRREIIKLISKRFDVNDVDNVDLKLIKVSKDKGVLKVGINYERREHLVGNIDIVATFDKQIEVVAN